MECSRGQPCLSTPPTRRRSHGAVLVYMACDALHSSPSSVRCDSFLGLRRLSAWMMCSEAVVISWGLRGMPVVCSPRPLFDRVRSQEERSCHGSVVVGSSKNKMICNAFFMTRELLRCAARHTERPALQCAASAERFGIAQSNAWSYARAYIHNMAREENAIV